MNFPLALPTGTVLEIEKTHAGKTADLILAIATDHSDGRPWMV